MLLSLIAISLLLAVWALLARRMESWRITPPLFLLLAGAVVEYTTHGSLADTLNSETAEQAAKIVLAVLLFVDANAMRAGVFGEHPRSAVRVLFLALPLSVGIAVLLGLWLLPRPVVGDGRRHRVHRGADRLRPPRPVDRATP